MKLNDPVICKSAVSVVPYLYGELAAREISEFESHLLDCGSCTDEFAEISAARFEVYEWKKLEFDGLATPVIHIPRAESAASASWLETLRHRFAGGWAIPAFGLGTLALVLLGATFVLWTNDGNDVAVNNSNIAPVTVVEPASQDRGTKPVVAEQQPQDEIEPVPASAPTRRIVPVHAASSGGSRKPATPLKVSPRLRSVEARLQARPRNTPTLNGFVEDEDTSLRLAELFDDIETSD